MVFHLLRFPNNIKLTLIQEIGTPNEHIWPGYNELPGVRKFAFADVPFNQLRKQFASELPSDKGFDLFNRYVNTADSWITTN